MNEEQQNLPKEMVYVRPVAYDAYSESDELSLIDLWLVLSRRKWIVVGITILCLALGAGYAWIQPTVYEYRSGIELAAIHGGPESDGLKLLTSREGSSVMLQELIIPEQREILFGEEGPGPNIQVAQSKDEYSLVLKSNAQPVNSGKVKQLHQAVADEMAKRHAAVLDKKIEVMSKPYVSQASLLRDQLKMLEEQLRLLSTRSDEDNGIRSLVDAQQMGDIREEIADTRVELAEATSAVELIREASQSTRTSYLAVESEQPVGMGKMIMAFLALLLGLMAGVFLAFFSEFISNARAQKDRLESRAESR
ncbi:MAG: Wzz/FepE/Etk N-terminal domain-containing protein [Desulfovibrionales bacterium]